MELQFVLRNTGNVIFNTDTGLDELETETVLQARETENDDWTDVPTIDQTVRKR